MVAHALNGHNHYKDSSDTLEVVQEEALYGGDILPHRLEKLHKHNKTQNIQQKTIQKPKRRNGKHIVKMLGLLHENLWG